jgi:hypothetical protein
MRKVALALVGWLFWASAALCQPTIGPPQALLCNKVAIANLAAGTTQLIAGVAGQSIQLCGYVFEGIANGTIVLNLGTGATCTSPSAITANYTTQVNGNVAALHTYVYFSSQQGQSLCAVVTGTGTVVGVEIYYGQY